MTEDIKNRYISQTRLQNYKSFDEYKLNIHLSEKYYRSGTSEEQIMQQIQRVEWQVLFEFCFSLAIKHSKNKDL